MMSPKGDEPVLSRRQLGIPERHGVFRDLQAASTAADLASISDLTVEEMAAIMELAHAVKNHPRGLRHALDGKQMVMFF